MCRRRGEATRETQQACMNRGDATQASKAQQAADDADASLDEGLAPVLEAWAHASTDASLVDADAAACHAVHPPTGGSTPPFLTWAAVFARYASCRVEAARARPPAPVNGGGRDASADDVEDTDRRERLQTACAVGRGRLRRLWLGRVRFARTASELLALQNENDGVIVDATLEEAGCSSPSPERWWRTTTTRARRRKCLWLS